MPLSGRTDHPKHGRLAVRLLRLYPRDWRVRYGDEVADLLESRPARTRDALDIIRGALDARLHPTVPSRRPGLAAVAGGGIWTVFALGLLLSRAPPDWPGYTIETIPAALVAVVMFTYATAGAWLRIGDGASRFERLAIVVALAGHVAWFVALLAVLAAIDYGALTAIAASVAAIGTSLVGLSIVRRGDLRLGGVLAGAGLGLLIPAASGWLVFGIGWSAAGFAMLDEVKRDRTLPGPR